MKHSPTSPLEPGQSEIMEEKNLADMRHHGPFNGKFADWMKDTQVFPVLTDGIYFRKKNKAKSTSNIGKSKGSQNVTLNSKQEQVVKNVKLTNKQDMTNQNVTEEQMSESKNEQVKASTRKHGEDVNKDEGKVMGRDGPVKIWSSQPLLKEFMIYSVVSSPGMLAEKKSDENHGKRKNAPPKEIDAEDFVLKPFYATDNITGKEIYVDPAVNSADDNGYYTVFDPSTRVNYVIDPPKLVVLDPITNKELVIDPRKPVGQVFSAFDPEGYPFAMDTSDQQPYIHEDPITGARLLKDETRVKAFTVIDPKSGKEVRIDPLQMDGKPYVYVDDEGLAYSVLPVIPGETPVLFENPETGETTILGGPVMIRDPQTGEMKYQEGPFTMRDPKTGQTIKQIGPILITDPETGVNKLVSNPKYVKHPQTGELTLEPQILYNVENGTIIPALTQVEKEKAKSLQQNQMGAKNMLWDDNLGVFMSPATQAMFSKKKKGKDPKNVSNETLHLSDQGLKIKRGKDQKKGGKIIEEVPSVESLLEDNIFSKSDIKRIKKFMTTQTENERKHIESMISKKKQMDRAFMQSLLSGKEKRQNNFIQKLVHHFGNKLKYYDRLQFKSHILEKVLQENEKVNIRLEEKVNSENNKALDAMLIELDIHKKKILQECNPKGTMREFPVSCEGNTVQMCNLEDTDNDSYKQAMEVFNIFKTKNLKLFNESLHRENDHIYLEFLECLEREMKFLDSQVDNLYDKVCCQKFLIIT